MEIGSLLVPMVITSQMAFLEKWDSKYMYLKVTGNNQVHHIHNLTESCLLFCKVTDKWFLSNFFP